ncbi:terminase small subunit [Atopobacter sp. AH10]|nr:terminase small subunit [Atopobacter sp. AH10]
MANNRKTDIKVVVFIGKLTIKQKKFADEYIISGNATDAYKKAGYSWKSENTAKANASKLLTNHNLKKYIDSRLEEINNNKIAKADEVLQVFTAILRGERFEIKQEISPLTGGVVELKQPPAIKEVIRAGSELMKRYPTSAESEKMKLEIEKLKAQLAEEEDTTQPIGFTFNRGEADAEHSEAD